MTSTQKNDTMTLSLVILLAMVLTFPAPGMATEAGAGRALPAFPGAEGWGSDTPGGRGGKVMIVTNLNPDGPGSLQEACAAEGPRIVVFAVSGVISNLSTIEGNLLKLNPYEHIKPFVTKNTRAPNQRRANTWMPSGPSWRASGREGASRNEPRFPIRLSSAFHEQLIHRTSRRRPEHHG